MIGAFIINDDVDVCFAQYGAHERLSGIRLAAANACLVILDDGSEEMFTTEINVQILDALRAKSHILVVHMSDDGEVLDEYDVPVSVID